MRAHTEGKYEMGRRFAIVIGVAAAGVMALGAQTAAAEAKTFKYTSKYTSASTANGYPSPGGTAELVGSPGSMRLKPGGNTGDLIDHLTITERLAPNKFAFKGKGIDNFGGGDENSGKLRHKFKGTTTVQADGSQQLAIEGHFTGSHVDFAPHVAGGRYHGASGHYKGSATVAPDSGVIVGSSKGKLRMQADAALGAQTATSSTVEPVDSTPPDLQLSGKKTQHEAIGARTGCGQKRPPLVCGPCDAGACDISVKASCGDEACTARIKGKLTNVKHYKLVPDEPEDLAPGETEGLTLNPTKKTRKKAGKALEDGKNVKVKATVRATDAAGNVATAKRTIRLGVAPEKVCGCAGQPG